MNTATKIIVSIGSIAVIASAGIGGFLLATTNDNMTQVIPTVTTQPAASSATRSSSTSPTSTSSYKNGMYTASMNYLVPEGSSNTMSASVTISDSRITAVTTNNTYVDRESVLYIDSFDSSVKSSAVGTSLADAKNFSRIGGASLTTEAFNSVLDTIRTQATT